MHPSISPISSIFQIENEGHKKVTLRFLVELNEEVKNFIGVEVLSQQSKTSYERHFSLSPSESVEVLVQVWAKLDSKIPNHLMEGQKIVFGKLIALEKSGSAIKSVNLVGSFIPGPTFSLSSTRLHFDSTTPSVSRGVFQKSFSITNLSSTFPLDYKIASTKSDHLQLNVSPSEGTLLPGHSQLVDVDVTLKIHEKDQLSESSSILVSDLNSKSSPQTILVSVLAETRPKSPKKKFKKKQSIHYLPEDLPELSIKGATPLDENRYEINLGQLNLNSPAIIWELEIENNSSPSCSIPLEYKISTTNSERDSKWMVIFFFKKISKKKTIKIFFKF